MQDWHLFMKIDLLPISKLQYMSRCCFWWVWKTQTGNNTAFSVSNGSRFSWYRLTTTNTQDSMVSQNAVFYVYACKNCPPLLNPFPHFLRNVADYFSPEHNFIMLLTKWLAKKRNECLWLFVNQLNVFSHSSRIIPVIMVFLLHTIYQCQY